MGRDKLRLEVGGEPILHRVWRSLAAVCEEVIVVGPREELDLPGARHAQDLRPGREGPLAGIEAGLAAARHPRVFVAAGDMPFLPPELVRFLLEAPGSAAAPVFGGGVHPLCAAYDRSLLEPVREALDRGERAVYRFLEGVERVEYVGESELRRFGDPAVFLMNVNSPEDLRLAREHAR
jgi:molybdopterin-guanine dinucleotide biosynthesis protein A